MADTDRDGLSDALEQKLGTNPKDKDSDDDGLTDGAERTLGTRPLEWDSDGDGYGDGSEVAQRANPLKADAGHPYGARERPYRPTADDPDGDRLTSMMEDALGTKADDPDSDGDGLGDWVESIRGTDPLNRYSDGAGDTTTDLQDVQRDLAPAAKAGTRSAAVDPVGGSPDDQADIAASGGGGGGAGGGGGGAGQYGAQYRDPSALASENARAAFLDAARAQIGDKYKFGAEADLNDADPTAFDSSELVQWAAARAGVEIPDGSWKQYQFLHEKGSTVSVEDALRTPGALVFGFSSDPLASSDRPARSYVGISLGDGRVLDVSERSGEVREMDPGNFYTHAALIPEMSVDIDSDYDGMIDVDERVMGRDPFDPSDAPYDPNPPDTDGDGMPDPDERVLGRNPFDPSDGTQGTADPTPASSGSESGAGQSGAGESGEPSPDSDGDGMLDVDEELMGRDPFDPSDGGTSPYENGSEEDLQSGSGLYEPATTYESSYDRGADADADAAMSMSSYENDDMDI